MSLELLSKITINNIKQLPATELRYYLFLLVAEIHHEKNPDQYLPLLSDLNELTLAINTFYQNIKTVNGYDQLENITTRLNTLIETAKIHSNFWKIKKIIMDVCASIGAIIVGTIAAGLGLTIGFFSQWNVLKGAYLGFMAGLGVGAIIGFRIPGKLVLTPWEAKLHFTLESIKKVCSNLELIQEKMTSKQSTDTPYFSPSYNVYENKAKKYIIDTFFNNAQYPTIQIKENAFRAFLKSEQFFEVCTTQNGFLDRSLKGNLGNHTLIRYKINDIEAPAMEFGARTRYPHWVDQKETTRRVTGQKLFEMIVLDLQLQETHTMNLQFVFDSFRAGDNDCLTYVDKILLGTQQRPTVIKRFSKSTDTWIGSQVVGGLFKFFSKIKEQEIDGIVPFLEDHQPLEIHAYKRST